MNRFTRGVVVTQRKPAGVPWESWIDQQIREATERGEFNDLPGKGKPLPGLDRPHDDLWWVKDKLRRENLSYLPPTLAVRREVEEARDLIATAPSEEAVRTIVAKINARIRAVNSRATKGPPSRLVPLNVDREVERWRRERA